jgi:4-amino-4-deoxy-L-arabinose transferase-like glycosyltransferase
MSRGQRRVDCIFVPACLLVAAGLATAALVSDSMTFDEAAHFTAGMSHLRDGDFRLLPETPPLVQMWAALPVLLMDFNWVKPDAPGWREGDAWSVQRVWLSQLNDGERLLAVARVPIIALLVAACLAIFFAARRLFGPAAGRLALILAALCPTLLAHGHLVTMDVPAALGFLLALLTFARLLERMDWLRLIAATAALAALALVKFSWPLVLPALAVMAVHALVRTEPLDCPLARPLRRRAADMRLVHRHHRLAALIAVGLLQLVGVWAAIWTCYRWRYSPAAGEQAAAGMLPVLPGPDGVPPSSMAGAWEVILQGRDGQPNRGVTAGFIRWGRACRVLPEAYLYGAAWTHKISDCGSPKYLAGEVSSTGWYSYFPIAFVLKTPLPTMLLLLAGVAAGVSGRAAWRRNAALLSGLATFGAVYAAVAIVSRFNIGQRHLLPIYPAVFIVAGAAAVWMRSRLGRWSVVVAVVWLAGANVRICPQYLGYFNELSGGPAHGPRYLVDSNVDWGQDLKRLAAWAQRHPGEEIKLAYFGSADPTRYGFKCRALPSYLDFGERAQLDEGWYVVSVTQFAGVHFVPARRAFWTPEQLADYRTLQAWLGRPAPERQTAEDRRRLAAREEYELLRRGRLLNQLRDRRPDDHVGHSLLVYRLSQADVDVLTR